MKRVLAVAVTVLLIVAAVPVAIGSGVAEDTVTLTIQTTDSDGDPRGGVSFSAAWDGTQVNKTTTQSSGEALLEVPAGATVTITIIDDQFTRNEPFVIEEATGGDVEVPVALGGTATVTVVEASEPVPRASVVVSKAGNQVATGTTGQDGTYETGQIETGAYTVQVSKPGYYDNETTITVGLSPTATVTLRSGAVDARFNVTDDHFATPRPLSDAVIEIPTVGTTLTTLGDGTQSTTLRVNRDYEVVVSKSGYQSTTVQFAVGETDTTLDVSIQRVPEMTLTAMNDRVVVGETGRITATNEYDEPIPNATVTLDGETIGQTDTDGALEFPVESAGNSTIEVTEDGRSAAVTIEGIPPAGQDTPTQSPTDTSTPTKTPTQTSGGGGPGFGVAVAIVALFGVAALMRRR